MNGDLERRYLGEARVEMDASRKIRGYAIVFDAPSQDLGGFREIIKPEAVDRTLSEALDVRALFDHKSAWVLGRTRAGTLSLRKDRKGLRIELDPPDTTVGRDVRVSVERGDITGMSFAFRVPEGGDHFYRRDGEVFRDVNDMLISEVSIVAFPAYQQTDVTVAMRGLDEFRSVESGGRLEHLRRMQRQRRATSYAIVSD